MNAKILECVVIVHGGFVPFPVPPEESRRLHDQLCAAQDGGGTLRVATDDKTRFWCVSGKAILGWYFRDMSESPQERMARSVEKLADEGASGNEWKTGVDR